MLSPSSLFSKIIGVLTRNGGENGTSIVVVSVICRSWTWHLSAFVSGWGHLISLLHFASMGLGNLFWPLICSLPRRHDLWSVDCQILPSPLSCRSCVQEKLASANINLPLFLIWSWFTKKHYVPLSRVDDVGIIMAHLRSRSLPVDFNSLSRKLV